MANKLEELYGFLVKEGSQILVDNYTKHMQTADVSFSKLLNENHTKSNIRNYYKDKDCTSEPTVIKFDRPFELSGSLDIAFFWNTLDEAKERISGRISDDIKYQIEDLQRKREQAFYATACDVATTIEVPSESIEGDISALLKPLRDKGVAPEDLALVCNYKLYKQICLIQGKNEVTEYEGVQIISNNFYLPFDVRALVIAKDAIAQPFIIKVNNPDYNVEFSTYRYSMKCIFGTGAVIPENVYKLTWSR